MGSSNFVIILIRKLNIMYRNYGKTSSNVRIAIPGGRRLWD
jgi:hypothetical protein